MSHSLTKVLALALLEVAMVASNGSPPAMIGNRADHFSYQPTPSEVDGREQADGVRPSHRQQQTTDQRLDQLDRTLLKQEGLGTQTVPVPQPR